MQELIKYAQVAKKVFKKVNSNKRHKKRDQESIETSGISSDDKAASIDAAWLQRFMKATFADFICKKTLKVYPDDTIVHTVTVQKHGIVQEQIFERMRERNIIYISQFLETQFLIAKEHFCVKVNANNRSLNECIYHRKQTNNAYG